MSAFKLLFIRLQEMSEMDAIESLKGLHEVSLVNNAVCSHKLIYS